MFFESEKKRKIRILEHGARWRPARNEPINSGGSSRN